MRSALRGRDRGRVVGGPVGLVDRVAVGGAHQLVGAPEAVLRLHLLPLQDGLDAGLHAGDGAEAVGVLERHAQRAHAAHRDAGDHGAALVRAHVVGRAQVVEERSDQERLPLLLAVAEVHVEAARRDAGHHDHHRRDPARRSRARRRAGAGARGWRGCRRRREGRSPADSARRSRCNPAATARRTRPARAPGRSRACDRGAGSWPCRQPLCAERQRRPAAGDEHETEEKCARRVRSRHDGLG